MPKMKTHRGLAKRIKRTGTGKLKRAKAYKSHILTKKDRKRKRRLRKGDLVSGADRARDRPDAPLRIIGGLYAQGYVFCASEEAKA